MAFAVLHAYPFELDDTFSGRGGCRAMAHAMARAGGPRRGCGFGSRRPDAACAFNLAPRFGFSDDLNSRKFEVVETPESYHVFFDASGFKREQVSVKVSEGQLHVRAVHTGQNSRATLEKTWALPRDVLHDGVSAKLSDANELTVILPKKAKKPKVEYQVPVEGVTPSHTNAVDAEQPTTSAAAVAAMDEGSQEQEEAAAQQPTGEKQDMEVDGTWVNVADEDVTKAKAKGKAPMEGPVVQETSGPAANSTSSDSD